MTTPIHHPAARDPKPAAPEGYMENAKGHLVPLASVPVCDLERDALVQELTLLAETTQKQLVAFKDTAFTLIDKFCQAQADRHNIHWGGDKGNITLRSYDGRLKITVSQGETVAFDERLQMARQVMEECGTEWAASSQDTRTASVVAWAFETDATGNLSVSRVLSLRSLDIEDPRWRKAQKLIADSMSTVPTVPYLRVYRKVAAADGDRPGGEQWEPLSLDLAKL